MAVTPGELGIAIAESARDGRFAEIEDRFAEPLRAAVSAATVRAGWTAEIARIGAVTAIGQPVCAPVGELVRISVPVTGERDGLVVVMSVDDGGRLHGLRLAAAAGEWIPPRYAKPGRFTETEVDLDGVPGTLSVPTGRGRHPAVTLLAGGGPFDRDETSGANKPLKDLAWGLASRGIVVLRFDKPASAATPTDEYLPAVIAATRLLAGHPAVDPARLTVLGHSLGGRMAPKVATAVPAIAGLVILAGDTQPMQRNAVRVARYVTALTPGPDSAAALAEMTRQAATVDSPALSPDTPAADLPFGLPATYWLDLRDYDPVTTAASLDKPMLILQGARDYQVTAADDLPGWRTALGDRANVTIRVYPADDHLFFPGTGPSTPADYTAPQHVDPTVVTDIARWLNPSTWSRLRR